MTLDKLAFVDIETTGMSFSRDRIIEVAVLRVENEKLVQTYQTLVNPSVYVSPYIEALTGIKKLELERAPMFEDISLQLEEVLSGCLFISHNVRFDYSFVKQEFSRLSIPFNPQKACSVRLSRHIFPQARKHDLDSLISRLGIVCQNRHRALDDAKVIWEFFQVVKRTLPHEHFATALSYAAKRASFPSKISQRQLANLPESAGVYIFYDSEDRVLYVGKSVNIAARVLSHFTQNDNPTDLKICRETARIEVIPTAGELGALLKEAGKVKELHPLYNRQLRRRHELTVAFKTTTENGYDTLKIEAMKNISQEQIPNVFGIFKSKKQAVNYMRQVCREYQLCPKLLGLEKSCMHYQFGWCKGACRDKELNLAYNVRFYQAFSKTKIVRWPFNGPITIVENNESHELHDEFEVNNWCYVNQDGDSEFDLDMYKIFRRYLRKNINLKNVQTRSRSLEPIPFM